MNNVHTTLLVEMLLNHLQDLDRPVSCDYYGPSDRDCGKEDAREEEASDIRRMLMASGVLYGPLPRYWQKPWEIKEMADRKQQRKRSQKA